MTQFIQRNCCEVTQLDEEIIILNTEHFTVTKLNAVGGYCWSLLSDYQTADSIHREVEEKFSGETLKSDIDLFLTELAKCGLVQNKDG